MTAARGPDAKLADSEIITMEIVGEFLGLHEDKALWEYFTLHWLAWFPQLGSTGQKRCELANTAVC